MNYQPPMDPYLDVVHQDEDVLVLNKPSGLLSVPGRQAMHKDSLQSRAQQQFPTATTVHRLDMETSGLIVMALNKPSHVAISRQFEQRQIGKQYIARVSGHLVDDSGEIAAPLICDWPNRPKQIVDFEHGKQALTQWTVISREAQTTLVSLKPVTGRSHQLRVHMLHIGHAIVGDQLYASGHALFDYDRLHLHSQTLQFTHPGIGSVMSFNEPATF
ncbi:RluA family pseudouridine synthase [Marinicella litoralis]|uniref:Pseudouridine synthase n=1 Tax=Marinicella litoralis TaxID=644220 RepID=A0A4R6XM86_9GAMM|nr:RluA family pseudouridine synthase [Marinicella litoralis]TDR20765.1 ribosomal large subunit pseudouridine synthase A [Marinicella litoralis]